MAEDTKKEPDPKLVEAQKKAEADKARATAVAKLEGLRLQAEQERQKLEKEIKELVGYGPGLPGKLKHKLPDLTQHGLEPPRINGRMYVGVCELTYDEFQTLMHMITGRAEHERNARYGTGKRERTWDISQQGEMKVIF